MFSSLVSFFSRLVSFIGGTTQDDAVDPSLKASIDPSEDEAISEIEEALEAPKEKLPFLGEVEGAVHTEEITSADPQDEDPPASSFMIGRMPFASTQPGGPQTTPDQGAQVIALRSLFPDTPNRPAPSPPR